MGHDEKFQHTIMEGAVEGLKSPGSWKTQVFVRISTENAGEQRIFERP